jgi:hypothetical protein
MVVSANTAAVISGTDDLTGWSDEELLKGQRRSKRGTWEGKPPTVVPMAVHRELIRRRVFECEAIIRESCVHAARYLDGIVRGVEEPKVGRQRAAEVMLERFLGKPTERHLVDARVEVAEPPWLDALRKAVRIPRAIEASATRSDDDIIDAEVIEDDLCLCGCGQPPRPGSLYFSPKHQEHAERKASQARPPAAAPVEDDPILSDDDELVLDDDDDPVLW